MAENKEKSPLDPISFSLEAKIEALLFVSPSSVFPAQIADALGESTSAIQSALETLKEELATRGISIQENVAGVIIAVIPQDAVGQIVHNEDGASVMHTTTPSMPCPTLNAGK